MGPFASSVLPTTLISSAPASSPSAAIQPSTLEKSATTATAILGMAAPQLVKPKTDTIVFSPLSQLFESMPLSQ